MRDRYGIPHADTLEEDRKSLFLDQMHKLPEECERITTFFVLQSVYLTFFGSLPSHILQWPNSGTESTAGSTLETRNEDLRPEAELNFRDEIPRTGNEASGNPPPVAETGNRGNVTADAVPEMATRSMPGTETTAHGSSESEIRAAERTTLNHASGTRMENTVDPTRRGDVGSALAPALPNRVEIPNDAAAGI
ncbi:hypothetical protein VTN77DRAFT_354 [Rasamsonia byssochlamydoides]|uniref:uncharacterized protein n=1 Tax=Rasamsonia byssochlamydoides TaxID=89139 RepID=UPI003741EBC4